MIFLVSLLLSLAMGFLPCWLIFKNVRPFPFRLILNLFIPIGIGLSSAIFIMLNLLKLPFYIICLVELIALSYILYKYLNLKEIPSVLKGFHLTELFQNPILFLLTIIYLYAWLMDTNIFILDSIKEPHGLWDAWNYWNMKAKFISKAPYDWPALFHQMSSEEYHVDYPLLQTGFIALSWLSLQSESVMIPILLSFVFTFCTIGLLSSAVQSFTGKTKGLIAGLILLGTPFYMVMGDSQYADNTVGFFFLATTVLLTYAEKETTLKPPLLVIAGITAGLSAWSKNEGLLFIACLLFAKFLLLPFRNYRVVGNEVKYLIYGALPVLAIVFYYKIAIAPPNDIIKAQGQQTFAQLADYSRYITVINWYGTTLGTFGKWIINPWWIFLGGVLYKGINIKKMSSGTISNILAVFFMLIGFFFIYIVTPLNLEFHLSTSLHRLFFQLFPTFLFLYFILLGDRTSKSD